MRWPKHKVVFRPIWHIVKKGKDKGKSWRLFGRMDRDTYLIEINLLKNGHPARTYLHELFHCKYPEKPEKEIYELERNTWNSMSVKKRLALYRKLFS